MKTQEIKTWLPCFSGFYHTLWEVDDRLDSMIKEDFKYRKLGFLNKLLDDSGVIERDYDDLVSNTIWDNIDNTSRENDIVKSIVHHVEKELIDMKLIKSLGFEDIAKPKEYNFSNDSGNISVVLCQANVKRIHKYLKDNYDAFFEYIKSHYTSCSGFFSSHSAYSNDWINKNDDDYFLNGYHKLGAVLEFILLNEDDEYELNMYYDVEINEYEYVNYEGMIADWIKEKAYGKYLIDNNETRSYDSLCVFEIQYVKLSH